VTQNRFNLVQWAILWKPRVPHKPLAHTCVLLSTTLGSAASRGGTPLFILHFCVCRDMVRTVRTQEQGQRVTLLPSPHTYITEPPGLVPFEQCLSATRRCCLICHTKHKCMAAHAQRLEPPCTYNILSAVCLVPAQLTTLLLLLLLLLVLLAQADEPTVTGFTDQVENNSRCLAATDRLLTGANVAPRRGFRM
jgi:hypothetical protein